MMESQLDQAIQHHQAGRVSAAEFGYLQILAHDPIQTDALHLLGMLACDRGEITVAVDLIEAAIELEPSRAAFHNTRARAMTLSGDLAEAETAYRAAWALRPDTAEIANNLGCLMRDRGDLIGAEEWLGQARMLAPASGDIAGNLADLLALKGTIPESLELFQLARDLAPNAADIHRKLGRFLLSLGRLDDAALSFNTAIRLQPADAATHNNLGLVLQEQGRNQAAVSCFRDALRCNAQFADAHYNLGCLLLLDNRLDEARDCHDRALEANPLHGRALWARCMVELPILYETTAQISLQRARYAKRLDALAEQATEPAVALALAAAVGASQPFFLPYQGGRDRDLQTIYGTLVAGVLHADTPTLTGPPALGERIRIGIVSGFFCEHTIWRLMLKGWLSHLDRDRFSIHAYHTGAMQDDQTALARQLCDRFVAGGDMRSAILQDRPHVLLYPELGMDPMAARLAGERLAPVQCAAWGQPETTGLPTMDWFLSSAAMEPDGAASHYSERLITLPNLGIHYAPDERQAEPSTRSALGLRAGAVIFWCGQALYKYLPQYDDVFARIAVEVGDCQFLFIGFAKSENVTACFRSRLRKAFTSRGLDADRHCVFLTPMSQERFLGTIRLADIMLDSIGWSGGKSTLDALVEAPVIVTHAGPLMRGRHTMGILTRIGLTSTIAQTIDDYVAIAVRLAGDPLERRTLRAAMAAGRHRVMGDLDPIRTLEAFFMRAAGQIDIPPVN
jgi:protein O-GlcNAc transferase